MEILKRISFSLLMAIGTCWAIVIPNIERLEFSQVEIYRLRPSLKPGSQAIYFPAEDALCRQCIVDSQRAIDRFSQYTYWNYFQNDDEISNPNQLAGIATCRDTDEALACFEECFSTLNETEVASLKSEKIFDMLNRLKGFHCEGRFTPGHASCRLADAHICDQIGKYQCGDKFEEYLQCVDDVLALSGQDCSGICSPARRFRKTSAFIVDMDCTIRATGNSQCKTLVSHFCFGPVKDSDVSYGIFNDMQTDPLLADDLNHACQVFQSPYECMDTVTNSWYMYFGFNVTYGCRGVESELDHVRSEWASIIKPLCGNNRLANQTNLRDICPTPDPSSPPPEEYRTVVTTTTTTTERTWVNWEPREGDCPTGNLQTCDSPRCGDDSHCPDTSQKCCSGCCRNAVIRQSVNPRTESVLKPGSGGRNIQKVKILKSTNGSSKLWCNITLLLVFAAAAVQPLGL